MLYNDSKISFITFSMRAVFLLDGREDKGEHILQNLKMFMQFSDTGMQLKTSFEKVE